MLGLEDGNGFHIALEGLVGVGREAQVVETAVVCKASGLKWEGQWEFIDRTKLGREVMGDKNLESLLQCVNGQV